jgi:hypothetical protein
MIAGLLRILAFLTVCLAMLGIGLVVSVLVLPPESCAPSSIWIDPR